MPASRAARDADASPYLRVKQWLKGELSGGRWLPGARMPSEAELVARFGVSRMTVNRALRELQAEGLVERVQGAGTFAAQPVRLSSTLTIHDLHAEIEARGHRHHAEVHLQREERAADGLAAQLGLAPGAPVFHTLLVHHDDGVPLQCEDRYVNPASAPGYLGTDFTRITPTQYLLEVAPLWEAQYTIEAARPTAQEAGLLRIERDTPCLVVVRRTVRGAVPITLARLVHPGLRYQLRGAFTP
ncbi:histidine utilization repressor [Piscinibacter sakaiensis]|uniref:Histidine utilization repressor n=1 Tax=Piscinibacter sakaiensis TaxID=1547922 RepID=A0A0K8NXE8_PISS1|nr:histidine utilization repressor [Piscinibacter sakaiensis]GAP34969.1 histidine utilization repressor [Piscinibacter sakaiensis]